MKGIPCEVIEERDFVIVLRKRSITSGRISTLSSKDVW